MIRLSHSDWASLSTALPALYSQRRLDGLAYAWMMLTKQLLSADLLITGELDTSRFDVVNPLVHPYSDTVVRLAPAFLELSSKVPELVPGYAEGILFGPVTSRITQRRFEQTDVFNAFHRPLGLRYQFAGFVPDLPPPFIGFVLQRSKRDFTVRDEQVLRHLCTHYAAAAMNVRAYTQVEREKVSLSHANELAGQGIVYLTYDYRLNGMTPFASRQLSRFFADWRNRAALPLMVTHWIREQSAKVAEHRAVATPPQPLKVSLGTQHLTIRLMLDPLEPPILLLTVSAPSISVDALKQFGLTPRETEVLYWLLQGKTNAEIALLLGTSEGTIRKHVEHILLHFHTQNRTATVMHVLEQLRN